MDTRKERMHQFEGITKEIEQKEAQREKRVGRKWAKHQEPVGVSSSQASVWLDSQMGRSEKTGQEESI